MPKIVKNNTVYAAVPSSASGIAYNGTTSGISANTVQGAIDELAQGGGGGTAATTTYDNTESGLSADNVQEAIDEIVPQTATISNVAIATFDDGADGVSVKSLIVEVNATQSGSGDPSPDNIRAITPQTSVVITCNDGQTTPVVENTYTVQFIDSVYGGSYDAMSGILTITKERTRVSPYNDFIMSTDSSARYFDLDTIEELNTNANETNVLSNAFKKQGQGYPYCQINSNKTVRLAFDINDTSVTSVSDLQDLLSGLSDYVEIIYPLATARTVQVSPALVKTLSGDNKIFGSTGNITTLIYFKEGCEKLDDLITAETHLNTKLDKVNPAGFGSFSFNRYRDEITVGEYSFSEGFNSWASGVASHAEGWYTSAGGMDSHAEGTSTIASGAFSHAEGDITSASGTASHAEGSFTSASGSDSHAEGSHTVASGTASHTEGDNTRASGTASHAEGSNTVASSNYSHAEGDGTTASGHASHAEGSYTTASHSSQHVFGEFNIVDPSTASAYNRGNYVEIVGNGTSTSARSNARTLDWSGNEVLSGSLKINGTQDVATQISLTQAEYDALVSGGTVDLINTIYFITDADAIATSATEVSYSNAISGMVATNVQSAIDEVTSEVDDKADKIDIPEYDATLTYNEGDYVTYESNTYMSKYTLSTPEPWTPAHWLLIPTLDNSYLHSVNPNGVGSFGLNRNLGSTVGLFSFAEGHYTTSSSFATHSEGYGTAATTDYAHSEGANTTASGQSAHAEGQNTIANHKAQHVFGEYNIADTSTETKYKRGNYVEIVGNGTNDNSRSNARTLDWNGNEVLAGGLTTSGNIVAKDSNGTTKVTIDNSNGNIACSTINSKTPMYAGTSGYNTQEFVNQCKFDMAFTGSLNDAPTYGVSFVSGTGLSNSPTSGYVFCISVSQNGNRGYVNQFAFVLGSSNIYTRYHSNSTWSTWRTI